MFYNPFASLRKENERKLAEVREDDSRVIRAVMKSMSIFSVNSYEAQIIQRDLIGMAQEWGLRNSNLQEATGHVSGFAKDIIQNSSGPCPREVILTFLSRLSGYFLVWFAALSLAAYGGVLWEVNPATISYYVGVVLLAFLAEEVLTPLYITERGLKRRIPQLLAVLVFACFTAAIVLRGGHTFTGGISAGAVIIASGLTHLVTRYLNIKNISRLAKTTNLK